MRRQGRGTAVVCSEAGPPLYCSGLGSVQPLPAAATTRVSHQSLLLLLLLLLYSKLYVGGLDETHKFICCNSCRNKQLSVYARVSRKFKLNSLKGQKCVVRLTNRSAVL